MTKLMLKKPLHFPRCLVDDRILLLRTFLGRKKKIIICPKCGLTYARSAIKDADPERWNRVRERQLFDIKKDSNGRKVLYHQGLGSRRIPDFTTPAIGEGARTGHI